MLPAFLARYAAGCCLIVAAAAIRQSGWKYLRLMAVVALALGLLALLLLLREAGGVADLMHLPGAPALLVGELLAVVWLFVNAAHGERIRSSQRIWPAAAGLVTLIGAILLERRPDALLAPVDAEFSIAADPIATGGIITAVLAALLLGAVTSAMLLGHRYLTDTGMTIAPLRRLAKIYLAIVAVRIVWVVIAAAPVLSEDFRPTGDYILFWVALLARLSVGLVATAIFAYMVWDCVKRRATQSATALFYLSMIFVFLGELAGQYLHRTEQLPL